MKQINIKVQADSSRVDSLNELAAKAEATGMKVRHTIDELGLITGSIPDDRLEHLRKIVGVSKVEADEDVWAQ
jgi:hypothetical protein